MITDLSVTSDSKDLDDSKCKKQRDNPCAVIDILYTCPKVDDLVNVSY